MSRIPLWRARTEALTHLRRQRPEYVSLIEDLFSLLDGCIEVYEKSAPSNQYARICGLTALKAKNLALGAYSLILDGLGQEAGALLRPFIEYTELLTYFKRFPEKVEAAVDNALPPAGARAKAIDGIYKEFREHLNSHASHSSYSQHSLSHLLEPGTMQFRKLQRTVPIVLDRNVRDFAIQLYLLMHEAGMGLESFAMEDLRTIAPDADALHRRVISTFNLEQPQVGAQNA